MKSLRQFDEKIQTAINSRAEESSFDASSSDGINSVILGDGLAGKAADDIQHGTDKRLRELK